jgi:hypothetical protein
LITFEKTISIRYGNLPGLYFVDCLHNPVGQFGTQALLGPIAVRAETNPDAG